MKPEQFKSFSDRITSLNNEYLQEYLGTSHIETTVNEQSSPFHVLDKNNSPEYEEDFFDLAVANILLKEASAGKYDIPTDMIEFVGRICCDGMEHCGILSNNAARHEFCNAMILNQIPKTSQVLDYLLWVERYNQNVLPIWFYYTLPLWLLLDDKLAIQYGYRSRLLIGISAQYRLTQVSDYNAERNHDVLNIKEPMTRLIKTCCRHEFDDADRGKFVKYILSTMREFSLITLAYMIDRSCYFDDLRPLGMVARGTKEKFHQLIVDTFYKTNRNA